MDVQSGKKTAVITGGAQGLGLALAKALSIQKYNVVIMSRTQSKLDAALRQIRHFSNDSISICGDVRRSEDMRKAAALVREKFGQAAFLINCAGIVSVAELEKMPEEGIKQEIDTDLTGAIFCTRAFLPLLKEKSRLLFVSSGFGLAGVAGYSVYCAAKAGLINFADAMKKELRGRKIHVHVAVPADIDTPGFQKEISSMPDWMRVAAARGNPVPADTAAKTILKKCKGNRFLIFNEMNVPLMYFMQKSLPKILVDYIMNRIFPSP